MTTPTGETGAGSNEIERNVASLAGIISEKKRDLGEKLEMINTVVVLGDDPEDRVGRARTTTQLALESLPQKQTIIEGLITDYGIGTPIDEVFVDDMLSVAQRNLLTLQDKRDDIFQEHEKEMVNKALNNLKLRRLSNRIEKEGEEEHDVEISGGRVFKFFLSEDTGSVRMEFPVITDPNKEPVKIGPEAVDKILGRKLTLDDYKQIAETLISLRGEAGKICKAYAQATDIWAGIYSAGLPPETAQARRKLRSYELRTAFGNSDPKIAPFCDIPLNAIFTTVVSKYPSIEQSHVPQPFES